MVLEIRKLPNSGQEYGKKHGVLIQALRVLHEPRGTGNSCRTSVKPEACALGLEVTLSSKFEEA